MIVGRRTPLGTASELINDTKRVALFTAADAGRVSKLSAYLDGLGSGDVPVTLTTTGNEVTDATRAAAALLGTAASGQMADGLLNDSSFGIRRAATNRMPRGQVDALSTNWTIASGTTGSAVLDTATAGKFTPNSCRIDANGSAAATLVARTNAGLALAAGVSVVGSIYFKGVAGQSYKARMRVENTDASTDQGAYGSSFVADGTSQLIGGGGVADIPAFAVQPGKTGDRLRVEVAQVSAHAESFYGSCAMIEFGVSVVAPYVATSGGVTATHAAGRVQASSSLLNATQMWFAARIRMGWAAAAATGGGTGFPRVAEWKLDNNNRLVLYFNEALKKWAVDSYNGGVASTVSGAVQSFAAGDTVTVIGYWTATTLGISVNGGAFATAARSTGVPSGLPATFDIGQIAAGSQIDSEMLWFAYGSGTPTNADAAALNALGNVDPASVPSLPASPTLLWPADTAVARTPAPSGAVAKLRPVIYDATGAVKIAEGDEVLVPTGQAAGWVDLPFGSIAGGVSLPAAGSYNFGVIAGGDTRVARVYELPSVLGGQSNADTYSDGASAPFGSATALTNDMAVYGFASKAWVPPPAASEFYYARLPFVEAQKKLGELGAAHKTATTARVIWHGTNVDVERGSFAVVRPGGDFDDWIGERIKITTRPVKGQPVRVAYCFVHNYADMDYELSVTRRVFAALGSLGVDYLWATVEKVGVTA